MVLNKPTGSSLSSLKATLGSSPSPPEATLSPPPSPPEATLSPPPSPPEATLSPPPSPPEATLSPPPSPPEATLSPPPSPPEATLSPPPSPPEATVDTTYQSKITASPSEKIVKSTRKMFQRASSARTLLSSSEEEDHTIRGCGRQLNVAWQVPLFGQRTEDTKDVPSSMDKRCDLVGSQNLLHL
nr:classical arabinogalactan protein 9-like [Procambarus clarkii]